MQRTARNYTEVRVARAARLFVLTPPIKFLICGVVVAVLLSMLKFPLCKQPNDAQDGCDYNKSSVASGNQAQLREAIFNLDAFIVPLDSW